MSKIQAVRRWFDVRSHLRTKCFIIGYWHLIANLFNTCCHLIIVYILTGGYQCEISKQSLRAAQWNWLEPVLLLVNFGAHGLYSFPLIFNYHQTQSIQYLPIPERNAPCYPMMSHVDTNDIIYFLFNVLWLKFTLSFITAVHKKNPGPMITFFAMTIFKMVIQLANFCVQSSYNNGILDVVYKIIDVGLMILYLAIIQKYIQKIREDKNRKTLPTFVENLLTGLKARAEEKKETAFVILEEKTTYPIEESKEKF